MTTPLPKIVNKWRDQTYKVTTLKKFLIDVQTRYNLGLVRIRKAVQQLSLLEDIGPCILIGEQTAKEVQPDIFGIC